VKLRIRLSALQQALIYATALGLAGGCMKNRKQDTEDTPDVSQRPVEAEPISAQSSNVGILDLKVELRDDGLLLHVGNLPAGAILECHLDDKPMSACHDGALYARPVEGDHKISAIATKDGVTVAIGESQPFTILPGTGGELDPDNNPRHPLNLQIDDIGFANGATVPMNKDFVAKFKFTKQPGCEAQLRCQYDSRTSSFWVDCDEGGKSFTIPKDTLAMGLQYLGVYAQCPGEEPGPILTMFWWGVPDETYEPLQLTEIKDNAGRHIVSLVRADDCPESLQAYECMVPSATFGEEWARCANGNVIDDPAAGQQVRMSCEGRQGPALKLAE
jgi:hypothetical protein